MITYFIKSSICLTLLLLFYHLVLEREKMHQFNRFYLLGSILFSFIAPLFVIYIEAPTELLKTSQVNTQPIILDASLIVDKTINYVNYFLIFSAIISSILLIRFLKNLFSIILKVRKSQKVKHQKAILVLVNDNITPHTFWNYIFINKKEYNSQKIEQELFTHELTHATQRHTFDVLLIEFLKIIFWFNPIFYILKKSIQLNHEFLADTKVIKNHKNISEYQYLLLNKTAWNNEYYLASNLNYLLTKKRLLMMTKQSSRSKILFKKLAVIPVLAGFVFLFAERVEANTTKEKTHTNSNKEITKTTLLNKGSKVKEYRSLNKTYENLRDNKLHYIKSSNKRKRQLNELYSKLGTLYFKLSKADKKKVRRPINPIHPYIKLTKNNSTYYKLRSELTDEDKKLLPPPPPKKWKNVTYFTNDTLPRPPKPMSIEVKNSKVANIPPPPSPVVKKGEVSNIPPPPHPKGKKSNRVNIPPPPPPISAKELIYKYPNATYFFNNKKVSHKEVIELTKNKKGINVLTQDINNKKVIRFSSKEFLTTQKTTTIDKVNGLTNKQILKLPKNTNYYLNNKLVSLKTFNKIDKNNIAEIYVKKNKDGTSAIYVTSK